MSRHHRPPLNIACRSGSRELFHSVDGYPRKAFAHRHLVGTSLVIILINSAAGFAAHAGDAALDYRIVGAFAAAAIIGSLTAGRFAARLPARHLRRAFAYLVLAIAAFVVIQAVINPPVN